MNNLNTHPHPALVSPHPPQPAGHGVGGDVGQAVVVPVPHEHPQLNVLQRHQTDLDVVVGSGVGRCHLFRHQFHGVAGAVAALLLLLLLLVVVVVVVVVVLLLLLLLLCVF